MNREALAKHIHESHRAQVAAGKTVAADKGLHKPFPFVEWDDLGENAKEGVMMNADYLLERFVVKPKDVGCVCYICVAHDGDCGASR